MLKFLIVLCGIFYLLPSNANDCTYTIKGQIIDAHDNTPLELATIEILETQEVFITKQNATFEISGLCLQTYHFIIKHIGCSPDTLKIEINKNIERNFYLEHHTEILEGITTTASKIKDELQIPNLLNTFNIQQLAGKDLAQMMQQINGIRILKTGANINKPVANGVFGDRITLVNNGVLFNTQDWGTEHAPEIDAYNIHQIEVINSSQTVEFTTQNLGATIAVDAPLLSYQPTNKYGVSYSLQTNNWQNSINTFYQKAFAKKYTFRVQASFKKGADFKTPNYTLSNTAQQELNFSLQQKFNIKQTSIQSIYSFFNQDNGILSAAHIGNIEDLKKAIASDIPLIIESPTYKIKNPKQHSQHHLLDIKAIQPIKNNHFLEYRINLQNNRRQEFDLRRGGRSSIPALDMHLITLNNKIVHHFERYLKTNWKWHQKNGLIYQYKNNTNNPNTETTPIIPDYLQYNLALFSIQEFYRKNLSIDLGTRYEVSKINSYTFQKKDLVVYRPIFNTYNFTANIHWLKEYFDWQSGISFSSKTPNISELYSNGLHHGTATIEYGNKNLQIEKAFGISNTFNLKYKHLFNVNINHKLQYIKDFIYLQPNADFLLTIKGAFPIFEYHSTEALFNILNIHSEIQATKFLELQFQTNLVRAKNLLTKDYIINIPADNFRFGLKFYGDTKKMLDAYFQINGNYTLKQTKTPIYIPDYKTAPNAYFLLNLQMGTTFSLNEKNKIMLALSAENILNTNYRDYLNRFRYFTDELGYNILFRINYFFN